MTVDMRLPGGDLVAQGIADLEQGVESIPSLLVSIGYRRLQRLGLDIPPGRDMPERRLYELLADEAPATAHSRYNAWLRRLISFEHAGECAG